MYILKPMQRCYVAYFDVLGMKALIRKEPAQAWDVLCDLFEHRRESLELSITLSESQTVIADRVKYFAFSDSVVLYTEGATPEDLCALRIIGMSFFNRALHAGVPTRGAITCGDFVWDKRMQIFTGPALVDAVEIGEAVQWIGVAASAEVATEAKEPPHPLRIEGVGDLFVPWQLPLKDGQFHAGYALDWPNVIILKAAPLPISTEQFYAPSEKFFGPLSGLPEKDQDKYANTARFINSRRAAEHAVAADGRPRTAARS